MFPFRLFALICGFALASQALAQTATVGGTVLGLGQASGMKLKLTYTLACIKNSHYFTLQTTDPTQCYAAENVAKCCSQSIKSTSFDNHSTVTCTCGIPPPAFSIVAPAPSETEAATTEEITIPPHSLSYKFATVLTPGTPYEVDISLQPTSSLVRCFVMHPSGTIGTDNVTDANVSCGDRIFLGDFD